MGKSKFLLLLTLLISVIIGVNGAWAGPGNGKVALIEAIDQNLVTEMTDHQLNQVRAKAGESYVVASTLQNFRFNLYTSTGRLLVQAPMVRLDNIIGTKSRTFDYFIGFSVDGGAERAGYAENEYASFFINQRTGQLKIYDPTFVYWWPGMDVLPRSDLGPRNGQNQIGSVLASTIEVFSKNDGVFGSGNWYQTRLVEVAAFWGDGSYVTNPQIGGPLVPGSTYNITMPEPFTDLETQYLAYPLWIRPEMTLLYPSLDLPYCEAAVNYVSLTL